MTTTTTERKSLSDAQLRTIERAHVGDHLGVGYTFLGRDREGYDHVADTADRVVHRIDPDTGDRERVTQLGDRHLDAYLAFVADGVGWDDRRVLPAAMLWEGFN